MFCRNCGTELKEGANFCPRCGAPVRNRQQTGTQQNVRMPAGKQKRSGGRKKIVVPVVTAAAAVPFPLMGEGALSCSAIVFHSPHSGHFPYHFADSYPQFWQTYAVFDFAIGDSFFIMNLPRRGIR